MKPINAILVTLTLLFLSGCGNVVPPGKVVIILSPDGNSKIIDKGVYKAYGRDRTYFVDGKLSSFSEKLKILCEDDINMDVDVKSLINFKIGKDDIQFIKAKVPTRKLETGDVSGFELSLDNFYQMAVRDIVRGSARNVVSKYRTDDIRPNREKIESDIAETVKARIAQLKYPLHVSAVLVSNIDYPESVKEMREEIKRVQLEEQRKAATAQAELAEAKRRVQVEAEKAKVRMVQARAQADENQVLAEALTPQFLAWRQYEVMEKIATALANGQSNTVFMMPYHAMSQDTLNSALVRDAVQQITPRPEKAKSEKKK